MTPVIRTSTTNNITHITLSRPAHANALNDKMIEDLRQAFQSAAASDVRAVIVSGDGTHFCAGADLSWMKNTGSKKQNKDGAAKLAAMLHSLWTLPMPSIVAVHGACYGGGAGIAAAADICIAAENARFCFSEVKLGLIPAVVSPYVVRAIGERRAVRYFTTAEVFDGKIAAQIGLANEAVKSAKLRAHVLALAKTIAANAPLAVRRAKQLARKMDGATPDAKTRAWTAQTLAAVRAAPEAQEGIAAFLQKRRPPWLGSGNS